MFDRLKKKTDLTVAIPLHGAMPYLDFVSQNIRLIPSRAKIIVSDQSALDGALEELRRRHGRDPRIIFRSTGGPAGWREHANALIRLCDTEYFSLLAQDDSIEAGYYERLRSALFWHRDRSLAFGRVRAARPEHRPGEEEYLPEPPIRLGRRPAWEEAFELDRTWNLGIPYRGVVRRRYLSEILPAPEDRFADQMWVFGIAAQVPMIEVPRAVYVKRYYDTNTHLQWRPLNGPERAELLKSAVRARWGERHPAYEYLTRYLAP